jgi:hypothetical protein
VILGDANGAGEDNRDVARMAVLLAGSADLGHRRHRQPPVRVEPRGGDPGESRAIEAATPRSSSPAASSR